MEACSAPQVRVGNLGDPISSLPAPPHTDQPPFPAGSPFLPHPPCCQREPMRLGGQIRGRGVYCAGGLHLSTRRRAVQRLGEPHMEGQGRRPPLRSSPNGDGTQAPCQQLNMLQAASPGVELTPGQPGTPGPRLGVRNPLPPTQNPPHTHTLGSSRKGPSHHTPYPNPAPPGHQSGFQCSFPMWVEPDFPQQLFLKVWKRLNKTKIHWSLHRLCVRGRQCRRAGEEGRGGRKR